MKKYLSYLCAVIEKNNLKGGMHMVNLKDYKVLGEFFPNAAKNKNSLSHCYGRVMKKLMYFDIVSRPEQKRYVIGVKAIRYNVSKANFMDKLDYYDMSYPSTFNC